MTFTHAVSTNNYGPAKFIVATSAANGTHTTLASAIAAASVGDTIFLRNSVTENVTLTPGVNIAAWEASSANTPSITGKITMTAAGTSTISGITLITNSDFFLAVTGSANSGINLINCYLNCSNNTGISFTSSGALAFINAYNCVGVLGTTGIGLYSYSGTNTLNFFNCSITNPGLSTTASSNSAGVVGFYNSLMGGALSTSSTGVIQCYNTTISTVGVNSTCITTAGTGSTNYLTNTTLLSGTASALSIGTGTTVTVSNCTVDSTNTNAVTGAGTLILGSISFTNTSNLINTTTVTNRGFFGGKTSTFTPVLTFGGASVGITYSSQTGLYTQIGNMIFYNIILVLTNKGSSTGNAGLTGFPVATSSTGIFYNVVTDPAAITLTGQMTVGHTVSSTAASLYQTTTGTLSALTNTVFANNSAFVYSGFYFTS